VTFSGPATLTNIGTGTISGTIPLTPTGSNYVATFTITLQSGDKINGTISLPATALGGGSFTGGSATVTGGTGAYNGATGTFPSITGSVSLLSPSVSVSGAGTITTGGGGGPVGPPAPTITDVLDAGSYTTRIAQGSIFVVKGTTLSASGFTQLGFPLPTTSNGVKITFTPAAGGAGTDAYLIYLYNQNSVNQLAAVLPSTVAPGNYNVTVTNGTPSAAFPVQVVQRKLGLITADSTGSGLAVIQNFVSQSQLDIDRFTTFAAGGYTFSPSRPGQVLIAWAVGMGPVTGGDNTASPGFDFTKNGVDVKVIVGGTTITPLYAGRAPGLAGADQINFQLPSNVTTGCTVPFQVSVNGQLSNTTFIAIAPDSNASACVQPGYTTEQLQQFDNGVSKTLGYFAISSISSTVPQFGTVKINSASGGFSKYTGFQLAGLVQQQAQITSSGACTVYHVTSTGTQTQVPTVRVAGLDAGNVTLNGPSGSGLTNQPFNKDAKSFSYSLDLGTEGLPISTGLNVKLVAGQYTVSGAGGNDVGAFSTSLTLGSPLTITGGLPTTVNRSAGLPIAWTGGLASDLVEIVGSSSSTTGTGATAVTDSWTFICTTNAGAGSFTVPASILSQLPAVAATSTTGGGFLEVASATNPVTFTAPLKAGGNIDQGTFLSFVGTGGVVSYQ